MKMIEQYKPAISQGVKMGVLGIFLFLIIYAIDPMFFGTGKGMFLNLAINMLALPIFFMIMGARNTSVNFNFYQFKNAFLAALTTAAVATLISISFNVVFLTVIDPNWEAEMMEQSIETTIQWMEDMGMPEEQVDEAMEKAREDIEKRPKGVVGLMRTSAGLLVWFAILALIIGAVQKDKEPKESVEIDEIGE